MQTFSLGQVISKSQEDLYSFFQRGLPSVIRLFKRIETGQIELMVRHGTLSEDTENIFKTIKGLTITTGMTL